MASTAACWSPRDARSPESPLWSRRSARRRCTCPRTSPVRRAPRRRGPRGAGRRAAARSPARRIWSPPAGSPRTTARPTRCSRRSSRRGSEHGWRAPAKTSAKSATLDRSRRRARRGRHPRGRRRARPPRRRGRGAQGSGRSSSAPRWPTTPTNATGPITTAPAGCRPTSSSAPSIPRTMAADLGTGTGAQAYLRELAFRDFYAIGAARVARQRLVELEQDLRPHRGRRGRRREEAVRGVEGGQDRLSDRRRGHAPALRDRLHAQPGADDHGVVPRQGSAPAVAVGRALVPRAARPTATWPAISTAGSGRRAAAPTPRRTSGCSIPTTQGNKFDPDDAYVKRWVPEFGGDDYPEPIVDHAAERTEALRRYQAIR